MERNDMIKKELLCYEYFLTSTLCGVDVPIAKGLQEH